MSGEKERFNEGDQINSGRRFHLVCSLGGSLGGFSPPAFYRQSLFGLSLLETSTSFFLSCYRFHGKFDFSVDLFGLIYEGNTGNYIDREIFYNGAYERPILFLLRNVSRKE